MEHPGCRRMTMRLCRDIGSCTTACRTRRARSFPPGSPAWVSQQIRGKGSPTSMSTILLPPRAVSRNKARRFRLNLADDRGVDAKRMASETGQCIVRCLGATGDELPLVRDVRGVDPRISAAPATSGRIGKHRLVKPDGESVEARRARSAPSQASPRRIAHPAKLRCPSAERRGQRVERGGVALECGLELEVAAGDEPAKPWSPIVPETSTRSPGLRQERGRPHAPRRQRS